VREEVRGVVKMQIPSLLFCDPFVVVVVVQYVQTIDDERMLIGERGT